MLLVGHVVALPQGARHAISRWPAAEIKTLRYGRGPEDVPIEGTTPVGVDFGAGGAGATVRAGLSLLLRLRRARFDVVAVIQPNLQISRSRGAILGFVRLLGAPTTIAIDPVTGAATRPIGLRSAITDLVRFLVFRTSATGLAAAAATIVPRLAPAPSAPIAGGGHRRLPAHGPRPGAGTAARGRIARAHGGHPPRAGPARSPRASCGRRARSPAFPRGRQRRVPVRAARQRARGRSPSSSRARGGAHGAPAAPRAAFIYQRYSLNNLAGLLLARRWGVPLVLEANVSEARWRHGVVGAAVPGAWRCARERLLLRQRRPRRRPSATNAAGGPADGGRRRRALRVIPNGVEVERFAGAAPMPLPFATDAFVFAFSGLFYPWHGVPLPGRGVRARCGRARRARGCCWSGTARMPPLVAIDPRRGGRDGA